MYKAARIRRMGCAGGCGARLGDDPKEPSLYSMAPVSQVTAQWAAGRFNPATYTEAFKTGAALFKAATSGGQKQQPQGGFQNWLESQSNTTLAIGAVAGVGLLLAVTR